MAGNSMWLEIRETQILRFDNADPEIRRFGPFTAKGDVHHESGNQSNIDPSNSKPTIKLFPWEKVGDNDFYEDELAVSIDIFSAGLGSRKPATRFLRMGNW